MQISITAENSSKQDAKEAIGKYQESGNGRIVRDADSGRALDIQIITLFYNTSSKVIGCVTCTTETNHGKPPFSRGYCDVTHPPSSLPPKLQGDSRGHSKDMHTQNVN